MQSSHLTWGAIWKSLTCVIVHFCTTTRSNFWSQNRLQWSVLQQAEKSCQRRALLQHAIGSGNPRFHRPGLAMFLTMSRSLRSWNRFVKAELLARHLQHYWLWTYCTHTICHKQLDLSSLIWAALIPSSIARQLQLKESRSMAWLCQHVQQVVLLLLPQTKTMTNKWHRCLD